MLSKASVTYGSCDKATRFAISPLAIRIEELSVHGNHSIPNNVIQQMKDTGASSHEIINQSMKDIISSYNKTNNFTHDITHAEIIQPSSTEVKCESKLRKKPHHEIIEENSAKKFRSSQHAELSQLILSQTSSNETL